MTAEELINLYLGLADSDEVEEDEIEDPEFTPRGDARPTPRRKLSGYKRSKKLQKAVVGEPPRKDKVKNNARSLDLFYGGITDPGMQGPQTPPYGGS